MIVLGKFSFRCSEFSQILEIQLLILHFSSFVFLHLYDCIHVCYCE